MKISTMSDLHFEQYQDRGLSFIESLNSDGIDVLCLPGDILATSNYDTRLKVFTAFCQKFKHVVYCGGNHEMYGNSVYRVENQMMRLGNDLPNLHILDNSFVMIDGQRFIGGTGWFKFSKDTTPQDEANMSDFIAIENFKPWVFRKNKAFNELMKKELNENDIAVSHHLPTYLAVHPFFKNSRLNQFFVNDCEKLIKERQPKLWLAGHTHFQFDIMVGKTRLVINPKGYKEEAYSSGSHFNKNLVIEI
jgi:predicted phosphodiesterase